MDEDTGDNISSSMSIVTAGTAGSAQSNSTWDSIFRAYGWTGQDDTHDDEGSAVAEITSRVKIGEHVKTEEKKKELLDDFLWQNSRLDFLYDSLYGIARPQLE